jgi:polyferredoxin
MVPGRFRASAVTWRYWVNGLIILLLLLLPTVHAIKFDFARNEYYVFGKSVSVVTCAGTFISIWAGSYIATLLADYVFGRLFCGWICSWGSLLRTLKDARERVSRKKGAATPLQRVMRQAAPHALTWGAALLSTVGLLNWFVDLTVLFEPAHAAFFPLVTTGSLLTLFSYGMLERVGLKFCQVYCPIGWYLTAISQQHRLRIDFVEPTCTHRDVCVRECPMALDPKNLIDNTETNSHSLCILCFDCISACNACAAKVEGPKPLTISLGTLAE